ncbi:MAG TPA: PP2C family serine/threonine-protein phosphatase [Micromonosporaceae bacterium]|nr:PP2C family serine/threonine-protein phosphatase [Micromonosporaceae bacterium]
MSFTLRSAAVSDLGLVRTNNEDSAYAGRQLLAVADGIGGLPAGELASDLVVRSLAPLEEASGQGEALLDLRRALDAANQQIREAADGDPSRDGMGTTVTALLLRGDELAVLHVGDSRGYLLRDGALRQVTRDDTFVQSLVDRGVLTAEEARRHPQRSLVTRAVQGDHVAPACATLRPEEGDRLLLCSDGLSDYVTDEAIAGALQSHPDPQQCAECLVKLALQAGGPDNITVVVADVVAG